MQVSRHLLREGGILRLQFQFGGTSLKLLGFFEALSRLFLDERLGDLASKFFVTVEGWL